MKYAILKVTIWVCWLCVSDVWQSLQIKDRPLQSALQNPSTTTTLTSSKWMSPPAFSCTLKSWKFSSYEISMTFIFRGLQSEATHRDFPLIATTNQQSKMHQFNMLSNLRSRSICSSIASNYDNGNKVESDSPQTLRMPYCMKSCPYGWLVAGFLVLANNV